MADSRKVIQQLESIDFAFIDGDHNWEGVVSDVVGVYNRLSEGGVIAMHDVGTRAWGWMCQDPGRLLCEILPPFLDGHAETHFLDSMCRELTMRLLSPAPSGNNRYFETFEKSQSIAQITVTDTIRGWGGLGFIHKRDVGHKLDLNEILAQKPAPFFAEVTTKPSSRLKRLLNKVVNRLP